MNNGAKMLGLEHIEAEATVLGTAIRDLAFAVDVQEKLSADAFTVPENQLIYEALGNLLHGIEPVDTQAIVNMANGLARQKNVKVVVSREYVSGLAGDFFKASGYITTLQSYRDLRTMSDFAFWFVAKVQDKPNPEQLFIEASDKFRQLMPKSAGRAGCMAGTLHRCANRLSQIAKCNLPTASGKPLTFRGLAGTKSPFHCVRA